jgi:hypothetical protein
MRIISHFSHFGEAMTWETDADDFLHWVGFLQEMKEIPNPRDLH